MKAGIQLKKSYGLPFVVIVLCVLFIMMLALSGKTKPSNIQTISDLKEPVKLRFISSWASYDTNAIPLKDVLNEFSLYNEDIILVDESMTGQDFLFNLKTDFATGNDPDVFGLWPGSDIELLIEQNRVADLTDLLLEDAEWSDQFDSNAWRYVTVNERIYGIPFELIYEALFVNIDMFDEYRVKVPTTYEELKEAVIIFRENDVIPIAFNTTPEGSFIYQNMVMKLGGKSGVEDPIDYDGNLNSYYIEGMMYMKELYDLGAFPEKAFYIDDKARNDLFMNKEAAMIVQGSWFIGEQGVDSDDETVEIVMFPSFEAGLNINTDIIYGCGNGVFHISQKAWDDPAKKENAIELLKHLTSFNSAIRFQMSGGFISNINIPEELYEPSHLYSEAEELIDHAGSLIGPTDSFIDRDVWEDIIVANFDDLLRGTITPDEIAELVAIEMEEE